MAVAFGVHSSITVSERLIDGRKVPANCRNCPAAGKACSFNFVEVKEQHDQELEGWNTPSMGESKISVRNLIESRYE